MEYDTLTRSELLAARNMAEATVDPQERRCAWCGGSMEGRSHRAKTCSDDCYKKRRAERARTTRLAGKKAAKQVVAAVDADESTPEPVGEPVATDELVEALAVELAEAVKARTRELLGL